MHYPCERRTPALLPGSRFVTETLPQCPAHAEVFANTCHPLSITKSPVPRWYSCPQALPAVTTTTLAPCPPLVQKCVVLYPEPCETTRLLPCPRGSGLAHTPPAPPSPRGHQKRVARSLPPCAPRCPEPGRLRFPPCAVRSSSSSSASCRGHCRPREVAERPPRCPELTSGYSLPLRGVTECPPQLGLGRSFLRECLGGVAAQRCSKGYPTQEFVACYSSEQRRSAEGTDGCPPRQPLAKGSLPREATKARSCAAQHPGKARCGHPRGSPRPSRLAPAAAKRSGHSKKSRCASKWLW